MGVALSLAGFKFKTCNLKPLIHHLNWVKPGESTPLLGAEGGGGTRSSIKERLGGTMALFYIILVQVIEK